MVERTRQRARICRDHVSSRYRIVQPHQIEERARINPQIPQNPRRSRNRDEVRQAIETLDIDHRIVVTLRFYGDLTVDQIAATTGLRPGTVKSRLHYAMRRLQAALDESESSGVAR